MKNTVIKILKTPSGFYAVLISGLCGLDFSLWWSGSKKKEDAEKVVDNLRRSLPESVIIWQ